MDLALSRQSRFECLDPRRSHVASRFRQPWGRVWLRVMARCMELLSSLQPRDLNYSTVTERLAVGGSFRTEQIPRLKARGVTAVVDCRDEALDPVTDLTSAGLEFLHLPARDRTALSYAQLREGVRWVLDRCDAGGGVFMHCEHGVGRGPLLAAAVLVACGHSAPEALH